MSRIPTSNWNARHGLAVVALAWLIFAAAPVFAQSETAPFALRMSEKEMNLAHTDDPDWQRYIARDLGFHRMNGRNLPFIELTNNLDAPLTEFHLTIGDSRFHFANDFLSTFALLAETTPGFSLTSSTVGDLGDELVVTIGNGGLKKGDGPLRFEIDLDVDPQYLVAPFKFYQHPDFRTVLFDMAGIEPYGPQGNEDPENPSADNALLWAVYSPSTGATFSTEKVHLSDISIGGALRAAASARASAATSGETVYYNQIISPYGAQNNPITLITLDGGEEIPEPASALLALFGLVAAGLSRFRSRRGFASFRT